MLALVSLAAAAAGVLVGVGLIGRRESWERELERVRIEALLANIPDGVLLTDMKGDIRFANPSAMEILGLPAAGLPSHRLDELFRSHELRMKVQEILKNHTQSEVLNLMVHKADGRVAGSFKTSVSLLSAGKGRGLGVMVRLKDVTTERRAGGLKIDFMAAMAAELRGPVKALESCLRVLETRAAADPAAVSAATAARRECAGIADLIRDAADLAALEGGRLGLAPAPADPRAILSSATERVKAAVDSAGLTLAVETPAEPLPPLPAEPRLLSRALEHLLLKAARLSPRGSTVRLALSRAGSDAAFTVEDSGPVIQEEARKRLFEPFGDERDNVGGWACGFGLALCRRIALLHQGAISAEPLPSRGNRFVLRVPLGS